MANVRNARTEADEILGEGLTGRVLEPSPPAVEEDYMADDPVARGEVPLGVRVVSPTARGDLTWEEWLAEHPEHETWTRKRWLAARPRVPGVVPEGYDETRRSLQLLATNVLTPARYRATGKIGLRWTLGGFGTPFFGDDEQVRVEGTALVVQRGEEVRSEPITTLGAAAKLVLGSEEPDLGWVDDLDLHDRPRRGEASEALRVSAEAVEFLANWFGLAHAVLERVRADGHEASRPQIWPEHFDPAIELLPDRLRGSYGFFPGDDDNGLYAYAMMWYPDEVSTSNEPFFNAAGYGGAELSLAEIGALQGDQADRIVEWMRKARDLIAAGG